MDELKPCPFCGSDNTYTEVVAPHTHTVATFMPDYEGGAMATCGNCAAAHWRDGKDAEAEVIAAWNTRTPSPGAAGGGGEVMPCYDPPPPYEGRQRQNAEQASRLLCTIVRNQMARKETIADSVIKWYIEHRRIDLEIAETGYWGRPIEPSEIADIKASIERASAYATRAQPQTGGGDG